MSALVNGELSENREVEVAESFIPATKEIIQQKEWSTLAKVVYRRTYARIKEDGTKETWEDTVNRVVEGNTSNPKITVDPAEKQLLKEYIHGRLSTPAGRGLWFSGSESQKRLGGAGLVNCWFFTGDEWKHIVMAMDLLMLGGGVGFSVEHRFVSKLPKIKKNVTIASKDTKDADFIVSDTREGWCKLIAKVLKSYFESGESFNYSTVCIRGYGEPIKTFGGTASGPIPLKECVKKITDILDGRTGKHIRPIDVGDIVTAIGEMVVAGNVRRSAILLLGDAFDKEYLKAKRWDLGQIPTQRAQANYSVVADDIDDVHPLFWKTYEQGEPFGVVNRKALRKFGRIGEKMKDDAVGVNPCAEATLANGEPCNLMEVFMGNMKDEKQLYTAVRLMVRYGIRVCMEDYHNPLSEKVIKKNMRIGVGLTGCLGSPLFTEEIVDEAYKVARKAAEEYAKELGVNVPIKTTVMKPSGTLSLLGDVAPSFYAELSRHMIRRVRFATDDELIPLLRDAGHHMEPLRKLDGSIDPKTTVVDFYKKIPDHVPCVDEGWNTEKQLDTLLFVNKYWSDQSSSVTIYYRPEEIDFIKDWFRKHLKDIKTISFLKEEDHGFDQAPLEAITEEEYNKATAKLKPIEMDSIHGGDIALDDCDTGHCPIK